MNLKDKLRDFNNLTLDLIAKINGEDLDSLEEIMNERQRTIESMESITYTKEEFIKLSEEINLLENNEILQKLLEEKKKEIRDNLEELNANRRANNGYNQKFYSKSQIFTKKI